MHIFRKLQLKRYWQVHPLALALYVSIIIVSLIPNYFQEYQAEIKNITELTEVQKVYYHDLDGDGITEKIFLSNSKENRMANVYYLDVNDILINQWNLKGKWLDKPMLYFGDYNKNGYAEVYCITQDHDSLFLNVNELLLNEGVKIENKYFSKAGVYNDGLSDVLQVDGQFFDIDSDQFSEFVYTLYSGYSKYPRATFLYNLVQDTFITSPLSGTGIINNAQYLDLNDDGIPEVTGDNYAAENIHYDIPYKDNKAWLVVLDFKNDLNYLFPPVECGVGIGSSVVSYFYIINKKKRIAAFVSSQQELVKSNSRYLKLFDNKGRLLKEKQITNEEHSSLQFLPQYDENDDNLYLVNKEGQIFICDTNLIIHLYDEPKHPVLLKSLQEERLDIDGDGEPERLFMGNDIRTKKVMVYRSNLTDPIFIDLINQKRISEWHISILDDGTQKSPLLILQADNLMYTIKYRKSPYLLLKYPIYFLGYLLLFFLFWMLQKAQRAIVSSRYETEKQLMQQQMALSKKQMEPHFMLNTVNNIGYLFLQEDKKKAIFYLGKFAALMRRGLMNVDKTSTSLEEELEFVEDYLVLQKQLMDGELDYKISIGENVEEDKIQIPHSLIYTFVENAIKHGLRPKVNDRTLRVIVSKEQKRVKISIQDNGVGRAKSKELKTTDTGKGMEIVKTIIAGYNKLHGGDISYVVVDVLEGADVSGTKVIIHL